MANLRAKLKELTPKVEFYVISLGVLFFLLFFNTVTFPYPVFCSMGGCGLLSLSGLASKNIAPIVLLLLMVLAAVFWSRFNYKYAMGGSDLPRKVVSLQDLRFENLSFLATYLIPLIAFDPSKPRGAVMLLVTLVVIGWIFINTNVFYQNPSLAILGYKIYRVSTETTKEHTVITRDELKEGDYIYPRRISYKVDFAMKKRK
ncbi:MAG: anti-phage protein KwaA [Pyrinomonadaceae bacterium]